MLPQFDKGGATEREVKSGGKTTQQGGSFIDSASKRILQ